MALPRATRFHPGTGRRVITKGVFSLEKSLESPSSPESLECPKNGTDDPFKVSKKGSIGRRLTFCQLSRASRFSPEDGRL